MMLKVVIVGLFFIQCIKGAAIKEHSKEIKDASIDESTATQNTTDFNSSDSEKESDNLDMNMSSKDSLTSEDIEDTDAEMNSPDLENVKNDGKSDEAFAHDNFYEKIVNEKYEDNDHINGNHGDVKEDEIKIRRNEDKNIKVKDSEKDKNLGKENVKDNFNGKLEGNENNNVSDEDNSKFVKDGTREYNHNGKQEDNEARNENDDDIIDDSDAEKNYNRDDQNLKEGKKENNENITNLAVKRDNNRNENKNENDEDGDIKEDTVVEKNDKREDDQNSKDNTSEKENDHDETNSDTNYVKSENDVNDLHNEIIENINSEYDDIENSDKHNNSSETQNEDAFLLSIMANQNITEKEGIMEEHPSAKNTSNLEMLYLDDGLPKGNATITGTGHDFEEGSISTSAGYNPDGTVDEVFLDFLSAIDNYKEEVEVNENQNATDEDGEEQSKNDTIEQEYGLDGEKNNETLKGMRVINYNQTQHLKDNQSNEAYLQQKTRQEFKDDNQGHGKNKYTKAEDMEKGNEELENAKNYTDLKYNPRLDKQSKYEDENKSNNEENNEQLDNLKESTENLKHNDFKDGKRAENQEIKSTLKNEKREGSNEDLIEKLHFKSNIKERNEEIKYNLKNENLEESTENQDLKSNLKLVKADDDNQDIKSNLNNEKREVLNQDQGLKSNMEDGIIEKADENQDLESILKDVRREEFNVEKQDQKGNGDETEANKSTQLHSEENLQNEEEEFDLKLKEQTANRSGKKRDVNVGYEEVDVVLKKIEGNKEQPKGNEEDIQWEGKIVGGMPVVIKNFPYQVSMQYHGRHMCGGSIIGKRYILTAAHCTAQIKPEDVTVKMGTSFHIGVGDVYKIVDMIKHPRYSSTTQDNDAAILVLDKDIQFNDKVKTVALPDAKEALQNGVMATVTGWGRTATNGRLPLQLQAVQVPIVALDKCVAAYKPTVVTENMVCAGYQGQGGKDSCQGDSGGPMVVGNKLVGIVSWGFGCADAKYPGVYTKVANVRDFIKENTKI